MVEIKSYLDESKVFLGLAVTVASLILILLLILYLTILTCKFAHRFHPSYVGLMSLRLINSIKTGYCSFHLAAICLVYVTR